MQWRQNAEGRRRFIGIIWAFQVVHSSFVAFVLVIRKIFMEVEVGRKNPICSSSRGRFTSRSLMLKPSRSDTPVSIEQSIYWNIQPTAGVGKNAQCMLISYCCRDENFGVCKPFRDVSQSWNQVWDCFAIIRLSIRLSSRTQTDNPVMLQYQGISRTKTNFTRREERPNIWRPKTRKCPIMDRHLPHLLQESSYTGSSHPENVVSLHLSVPIARRQSLCLADPLQGR